MGRLFSKRRDLYSFFSVAYPDYIAQVVDIMDFKRADRVGELIHAELADIVLRKLKDPRVGFLTITGVRVSDDLKHAKIFVSVLGGEEAKKDTLKGLRSAVPFMQREVGRRLKLRYTPEIMFVLDESIEKGAKMLETLKELEETEEKGDDEP